MSTFKFDTQWNAQCSLILWIFGDMALSWRHGDASEMAMSWRHGDAPY